MRFKDLRLVRFGSFTDVSLDFGEGEGFHLIYGLNEAGKTTALRAIGDFLYGMPHSSPDAFRHDTKRLLVGATIADDDGGARLVFRRKGRKNTLLDADLQPVADTELSRLLASTSREGFHALYGLSHDDLVVGAGDLLAGRGELGAALFAASAGVRSLHHLMAELSSEADRLYRPHASTRPLNSALSAYRKGVAEAGELLLKPPEYIALLEERSMLHRQAREVERELHDARAELHRAERILRVWPSVCELERLRARIEELGDVPLLPEDAAEKRSAAEARLSSLTEETGLLLSQKEQVEEAVGGLTVPAAILAEESAIKRLVKRAVVVEQAVADRVKLTGQARAIEEEISLILADLSLPADYKAFDELWVPVSVRERVKRLAQRKAELGKQQEAARRELARAESSAAAARAQLEGLPPERDPGALERSVAAAGSLGDVEKLLRETRQNAEERRRKVEQTLGSLNLVEFGVSRAVALPAPSLETIRRFQRGFGELDSERAGLDGRMNQLRAEAEAMQTRIRELAAQGSVPTDEELSALRSSRDSDWRAIRGRWLPAPMAERDASENIDADQAGEFAPHVADADLAVRFEGRVTAGDELADRMRREADRVAAHELAVARRLAVDDELKTLADESRALANERAVQQTEWESLWLPVGVTALPPAEMAEWRETYVKLLERHEECTVAECAMETAEAAVALSVAEVRDALEGLAEAGLPEEAPSRFFARARGLLADIQSANSARREAERRLVELDRERRERLREMEQVAANVAVWAKDWETATGPLALPGKESPEGAVAALDRLNDLREKRVALAGLRSRIDGIAAIYEKLSAAAGALAEALCADLNGDDPLLSIAEFERRFAEAAGIRDRRAELTGRLERANGDLRRLAEARGAVEEDLDLLMKSAGCGSRAELAVAEALSKDRRQSERRMSEIAEALAGERVPLGQMVEEALSTDTDEVAAQVTELNDAIAGLEVRLKVLQGQLGELNAKLASYDGSDAAARALQEAQSHLAKVPALVERFTVMTLARRMLEVEISRFRETNKGGLLDNAGAILSRVTLGSFGGLEARPDEGDRLVLHCVRQDGEEVPVEGLSEGSRDQLFLALRLAAIEERLAQVGPRMPLVVDDIFINFDDLRAKAGLEVLAGLAQSTQVLFFTHHQRLVELAESAVPQELLTVHTLNGTVL